MSKKINSFIDKFRRILGENVQTQFQQSELVSSGAFEHTQTMHCDFGDMSSLIPGLKREEVIRGVADLNQRLYYVYMLFMDAKKEGVKTQTDIQTVMSARALLSHEILFKFNTCIVEFDNEFQNSSKYEFVLSDKKTGDEFVRLTLRL